MATCVPQGEQATIDTAVRTRRGTTTRKEEAHRRRAGDERRAHRRHAAAQEAGLIEVPVAVFGSDDPLDIETALIETNRQREKTNEQSGREATRLLEIERERAKRRQATNADGSHTLKDDKKLVVT